MQNVTITFVGHRSNEIAQRFYTWIVDGGLEDGIIENLSDDEIDVQGILDINNKSLSIAIESKEPTNQ